MFQILIHQYSDLDNLNSIEWSVSCIVRQSSVLHIYKYKIYIYKMINKYSVFHGHPMAAFPNPGPQGTQQCMFLAPSHLIQINGSALQLFKLCRRLIETQSFETHVLGLGNIENMQGSAPRGAGLGNTTLLIQTVACFY